MSPVFTMWASVSLLLVLGACGPGGAKPADGSAERKEDLKWTDPASVGLGIHLMGETEPLTLSSAAKQPYGEYHSSSSSASSSTSNSSSSSSTTYGLIHQMNESHNASSSNSQQMQMEHVLLGGNQGGSQGSHVGEQRPQRPQQPEKPSEVLELEVNRPESVHRPPHHRPHHHTTPHSIAKKPPNLPPKPVHPVTVHWEPPMNPIVVNKKKTGNEMASSTPYMEPESFGVSIVSTGVGGGDHAVTSVATSSGGGSTTSVTGQGSSVVAVGVGGGASYNTGGHGPVIPVVVANLDHTPAPQHGHDTTPVAITFTSTNSAVPSGNNEVYVLNLSGSNNK